jgi:hypothetical protein
MKRIYTLIAICCALLPARAQYESFFGGESWEYATDYLMTCYTDEYDPNVFNTCCATFSIVFHRDDTLSVGDKIYYHSALYYYYLDGILLREDTVTGRLYGRYSTEGEEYLLCDMSLSEGDTFILPNGSAHWNPYNYMMLVDSVSYVNGKKVIHLSLMDCVYELFYDPEAAPYMSEYNISLRFMEGVGPIYGICPTSAFSLENAFGLLLCMHKDDTLYYMTHETLGCAQYGADVPQYPESYLQVYPNPVAGQLTLEFVTEEEVTGTVMVRDMVGRVCRKFAITDKKQTFDVSFLQPGVYMVTFMDEKNRTVSKKIVKQ